MPHESAEPAMAASLATPRSPLQAGPEAPAAPAHTPRAGMTPANRLLAVLPVDTWQRLAPHVELVDLRAGEVLHEAGMELTSLYFPDSAIVTLVCMTASGTSAEIAMVGHEGVVGVALFMGGASTTSRAVVQKAGRALRLPAGPFRQEFERGGVVMRLMLRYAQSLITQMAQTAVCNRYHVIGQRLSRWLLMNLDRQDGTELAVTHETIADLLGVRREGITEALAMLKQLAVIDSQRGHIRVLDRQGLQLRACECYAVVKRETDRLLPPHPQHPGA